MALTRKSGNGGRAKCALPLVMGFVVGLASAYYCLLLTGCYEDDRRPARPFPVAAGDGGGRRRFHRADAAVAEPNGGTASVMCVVFVDDVDSVLMQQNVWLDRCDGTTYVSGRRHRYVGRVVTDTFSADPWRYYCRTLVYAEASSGAAYDWIFLARSDLWLVHENLARLTSLLAAADGRERKYYAGSYADGVLSTDAGVLLAADTLTALVRLLGDADACAAGAASAGESRTLDFYLGKLNGTPVSNTDAYGCSLFNPISLFEAFNVNGPDPNVPKTCFSRYAVSFQLGLHFKYAMFYKYVLYGIRLVNRQDLMSTNISPLQLSDDIWWTEGQYELNTDPRNMSQSEFYELWLKIREIIL